MDTDMLIQFKQRVQKELNEDIIPFWSNRTLDETGGFIGRMANDGAIDKNAPKGLVLNTRILWTFSALYVFQKKQEHLVLAKRAYDYLMSFFWDPDFGGTYWMLDSRGKPLDNRKQIYGQSFAIYALSEYYRASQNKDALDKAKAIFDLLEKHVWDRQFKGYFESFDRDWTMSKQQQLTSGDMAEKKSMNTSLHALEGIANLYDVSKDPLVGQRVDDMLNIFADKIASPDGSYCQLFFDEQWNSKIKRVSFGHDIEASWLVYKDAQILNNPATLEKIRLFGLKLAKSVFNKGLDNKKSMFYEAEPTGITNSEKHWWVQAEAVVGFLNAYELTGRQDYLDAAFNIWQFIEDKLIDRKNGEWFWKVSADGKVDQASFKVSEWKCPYHNSRACIEILNRLDGILKKNLPSKVAIRYPE